MSDDKAARPARVQKEIADAIEPIMAAHDVRALVVFGLQGADAGTVTPFDVVSVPDASEIDYEAMLLDFVRDVVNGDVAPETTTVGPFLGRSH